MKEFVKNSFNFKEKLKNYRLPEIKIIGFWVWVLDFIPNFGGLWVWVLGVSLKLIPKTQTQFFWGVNVCLRHNLSRKTSEKNRTG